MRYTLTWAVLGFSLVAEAGGWAQPAARAPHGTKKMSARPGGLGMVERLNRMAPEERRRVLESLPPERRTELERGLERYQRLSPEERAALSERFRQFQELSPGERERMRRAFRRMNALGETDRRRLRRELAALRAMSPAERQERLESDEFKSRFSAAEREIIEDLAQALPDRD
jgi:flagellar motor switch protein FliG